LPRQKLAWIWDRRHIGWGSAPFRALVKHTAAVTQRQRSLGALQEKAPNALNGNGRRAKLVPRKNRPALPRHLEREPPGHRPAVFVDRLDDHPIGPGLKV